MCHLADNGLVGMSCGCLAVGNGKEVIIHMFLHPADKPELMHKMVTGLPRA